MTTQIHLTDKAAEQSLDILQLLLGGYQPRDFSVRLWDGSQWPAEIESPQFTLVLKHPGALRRMFQSPNSDLSLGEAYIYDDFDIEGNIEALFAVTDYLMHREWNTTTKLRLGWLLHRLPNKMRPRPAGRRAATLKGKPHSIERDKQAIAYHYDVSNDFYALWLDRQLVYSCAYFKDAEDSLDTAQEQKLDYICRKLRLRPSEKLLDIGCGWGGLVMHAARHYGVEAVGISLSQNQVELANQRIREAGLSDRCRVEMCDYREMKTFAAFDKLVSVGMFEHVGEALLPVYFQQAWKLLRPGGVFLNHGIAQPAIPSPPVGSEFFKRYVFPDGELAPISTTLRQAELAGFEVRDVESLREHYLLTLRQWVKWLETQRQEACDLVGEPTYRTWRLFMSASAYYFKVGWVNVYQSLLVKPDRGQSGLPLTRADWYQP